jgi:hypothetical protein
MEELKFKKNMVGATVYCSTLNQHITIKEGDEEKMYKLGLDVFVKRRKPKLQKKNDKVTKKRSDNIHSDGDGINNDSES